MASMMNHSLSPSSSAFLQWPHAAAEVCKVSASTMRRLQASDPQFPALIPVSPRRAVIEEAALVAYLQAKAVKSGG
jgi:hypothetical protein